MSAKFDYAEAERAVAFTKTDHLPLWDYKRCRDMAELLPSAVVEIRRLLGVVHEAHNNGAWKTIQCACPDCAAWRATTKETK